jgi:hypothetical protein
MPWCPVEVAMADSWTTSAATFAAYEKTKVIHVCSHISVRQPLEAMDAVVELS